MKLQKSHSLGDRIVGFCDYLTPATNRQNVHRFGKWHLSVSMFTKTFRLDGLLPCTTTAVLEHTCGSNLKVMCLCGPAAKKPAAGSVKLYIDLARVHSNFSTYSLSSRAKVGKWKNGVARDSNAVWIGVPQPESFVRHRTICGSNAEVDCLEASFERKQPLWTRSAKRQYVNA